MFPLFVDIAEEFLREFTLAYNTEYGIEYTKNLLKEIDAESFAEEKPVYLLLHRSVSCWSLCNKYAKLTQQYLLMSRSYWGHLQSVGIILCLPRGTEGLT